MVRRRAERVQIGHDGRVGDMLETGEDDQQVQNKYYKALLTDFVLYLDVAHGEWARSNFALRRERGSEKPRQAPPAQDSA